MSSRLSSFPKDTSSLAPSLSAHSLIKTPQLYLGQAGSPVLSPPGLTARRQVVGVWGTCPPRRKSQRGSASMTPLPPSPNQRPTTLPLPSDGSIHRRPRSALSRLFPSHTLGIREGKWNQCKSAQ